MSVLVTEGRCTHDVSINSAGVWPTCGLEYLLQSLSSGTYDVLVLAFAHLYRHSGARSLLQEKGGRKRRREREEERRRERRRREEREKRRREERRKEK